MKKLVIICCVLLSWLSVANANVVLVEYVDYLCPHCHRMQPIIDDVIKKNNNKIKVIVHPLGVLAPYSEYLARAALSAKKEGQFTRFNSALMASNSILSPNQVMNLVELLGLSFPQFKQDLFSKKITQDLKNNSLLAQSHSRKGEIRLPLIIVGNAKKQQFSDQFVGEVPEAFLQKSIDRLSK